MAISSFQTAQRLCMEKQKLSVEQERTKLSKMRGEACPMTSSMSESWVSVNIELFATVKMCTYFDRHAAENTRDHMLDQLQQGDVG